MKCKTHETYDNLTQEEKLELQNLYDYVFKDWSNTRFFNVQYPDILYRNYATSNYYPSNIEDKRRYFEAYKNIIINYNGSKYVANHRNRTFEKLKELRNKPNGGVYNDPSVCVYDKNMIKLMELDLLNNLENLSIPTSEYEAYRDKILREYLPTLTSNACIDTSIMIEGYISIVKKINLFLKRNRARMENDQVDKFMYAYGQIMNTRLPHGCFMGDDTVAHFNISDVDNIYELIRLFNSTNNLKISIEKYLKENPNFLLTTVQNHLVNFTIKDIKDKLKRYLDDIQDYVEFKAIEVNKNLLSIIDSYNYAYNSVVDMNDHYGYNLTFLDDIKERHKRVIKALENREKYKLHMKNIKLRVRNFVLYTIDELNKLEGRFNDILEKREWQNLAVLKLDYESLEFIINRDMSVDMWKLGEADYIKKISAILNTITSKKMIIQKHIDEQTTEQNLNTDEIRTDLNYIIEKWFNIYEVGGTMDLSAKIIYQKDIKNIRNDIRNLNIISKKAEIIGDDQLLEDTSNVNILISNMLSKYYKI